MDMRAELTATRQEPLRSGVGLDNYGGAEATPFRRSSQLREIINLFSHRSIGIVSSSGQNGNSGRMKALLCRGLCRCPRTSGSSSAPKDQLHHVNFTRRNE